jgi:hypothetical protein
MAKRSTLFWKRYIGNVAKMYLVLIIAIIFETKCKNNMVNYVYKLLVMYKILNKRMSN